MTCVQLIYNFPALETEQCYRSTLRPSRVSRFRASFCVPSALKVLAF